MTSIRAHGVWPFESRHLGLFVPTLIVYGLEEMLDSLKAFDSRRASLEECFYALARVTVIDAARRRATPDMPTGLLDWIAEQEWEPQHADTELASSVVASIIKESALRDGWLELEAFEPGIVDDWCDLMEDLRRRLC